jgi:cytochrome c oxidase assembly protein subunit 15
MVFLKAKTSTFKSSALLVGIALVSQIILGVSNIWFSLPLSIAVGHNVVAVCLMMTLIALTYRLRRKI